MDKLAKEHPQDGHPQAQSSKNCVQGPKKVSNEAHPWLPLHTGQLSPGFHPMKGSVLLK